MNKKIMICGIMIIIIIIIFFGSDEDADTINERLDNTEMFK